MLNSNEKPQPKGVLMLGPLPVVPLIIALIWIVMTVIYTYHGLSRSISLPVVLGTIVWFIIWLARASRRG